MVCLTVKEARNVLCSLHYEGVPRNDPYHQTRFAQLPDEVYLLGKFEKEVTIFYDLMLSSFALSSTLSGYSHCL